MNPDLKKILIIKLGYSETLDPEIGRVPSLGDVLRTTPILWALKEKFPDSHITWLVSEEAKPLLKDNPLLDRILAWDSFLPFQLMKERFDILINLEKIPGICAMSDMIDAWTRYGFRFDSNKGTYHAYEKGLEFIDYLEGKRDNNKEKALWQKVFIEMIGVRWRGQEYIIGYKPGTEEIHDIGLNYKVGSKWRTKAMPLERWEELEKRLAGLGYRVSWQKGLDDIYEYMDWINSCRLLLTQDSLGLHIALGLKKKVVALFGPTDPQEIYLYNSGKVIHSAQKCEKMPCYNPKCITGLDCMINIELESVVEAVEDILNAEVPE
jgi:heptosyltransferase-2